MLNYSLTSEGGGYTPGDYTGDGKTDLAVYDEATGCWYIRGEDGTVILWQMPWGGPGFTPVPGDYNGDGISDLAVYYKGYWFVETVDGTLIVYAENWGAEGYDPIGR